MTRKVDTKPRVLFVTDHSGSEIERHAEALIALLAPYIDIDVLRPLDHESVELQDHERHVTNLRTSDWCGLVASLQARGYCRVRLHHVRGFPAEILRLPTHLGLPYDLTLLDCFPFCPQYALSTGTGAYCGEPDVAGCTTCIRQRPHDWGWPIERWRETMRAFLINAARVNTPSHDIADRIRSRYPGVAIEILPHPPRSPFSSSEDAQNRDQTEPRQRKIVEQRRLLKMKAQQCADDQGVIEALRFELAEIKGSISWRTTAPLRVANLGVQRLRGYGKRIPGIVSHGFRSIPSAATILREEGPAGLWTRVRYRLRNPERLSQQAPNYAFLSEAVLLPIGPLSLDTCLEEDNPRISIVIPVHEHHHHTFNCLHSLARHTDLNDVEIIVVDDASPEPARDVLNQVQGARVVENLTNLGFIGSCHRGADMARGAYLVFLNNDIKVRAGWLDAMLDVFRDHTDAGLVGARLINPDGTLQEAGGIVWKDASAWNWGRDQDPSDPQYSYVRAVDYCSGACLAIRRSDWSDLGGFDRAYEPAYYEDTDLAFRIRAAGKRVYFQPRATVIHYEGVSSGKDESQGIKHYQVVNRDIFYKRWQSILLHHRSNGVNPRLEADRDAHARVLVIEACLITPDQDARSLRMQAFLELLVELGCKVSFVAESLEYREPYIGNLQQSGIEVWYSPYIRSVDELLLEHGAEYDMVICCRHYVAARYLPHVRQWASHAKVVFDTVDLHYLREQRQAELEKSSELQAEANKTRQQELGAIASADVTLVVSPVEQDILAREAPKSKVRILSNIHEPRPIVKPFSVRKGLLFVGEFRRTPNVDAMEWFVSRVWPLLHQDLSDIELLIVGSNMPQSIQALEKPGVHVLGFVDDIDPLLESARISLAPMRDCAGVKGKIIQAMAWGLPVVATSVAAGAMQLEHEREILVADTAEEFADAIVRLYGDEALWNKLSKNGQKNVEQHFSRATARKTLAQLLELDDA